MIQYATMGSTSTDILEDFEGYNDAREWCESYNFLTQRAAFLLKKEPEGFYELMEVVG